MKKAIVLANGDLPKKTEIKYFKKNRFETLVCADGGANSARKLNIVPNVIIGDLDSITKSNLDYFKDKSKIIKLKRQNDTDVEKSIKYLIDKGFKEIVLLGATGDRLDHSFCNMGIVIKFFNQINISILHRKSFLKAYSGKVSLASIKDETISIYGIDKKTKITSAGLKYKLKDIALPFGVRESTSNVATKKFVELNINGGIAFVIRDFETMVKNDFI